MCRLRLWIPVLFCCAAFLCQIIGLAIPYWVVLYNSSCGNVNFGIFKTQSEFGRCKVEYAKRNCSEELNGYNGTQSVTNGGRTCQAWSSQTPHRHLYREDKDFPMDGSVAEASNYCREMSLSGTPWCYTMDKNVPREKCNLKICDDSPSVVGSAILNIACIAAGVYGGVILLGFFKLCIFKKNLQLLYHIEILAFLAGILTLVSVILFGVTEKYISLPNGKGKVVVSSSSFHVSFYLSILASIMIFVAGILFCVVEHKDKASKPANSTAVNGPSQRRVQVQNSIDPTHITVVDKKKKASKPANSTAVNGPSQRREQVQNSIGHSDMTVVDNKKKASKPANSTAVNGPSQRREQVQNSIGPLDITVVDKKKKASKPANIPAVDGTSQRREQVQNSTGPTDITLSVSEGSSGAMNGQFNRRSGEQVHKQTYPREITLSVKGDSHRQPFYIEQAVPRSATSRLGTSVFSHQGNSPGINGPSQRKEVVQKLTCPQEETLSVYRHSHRQHSHIDKTLPCISTIRLDRQDLSFHKF